MTTFEQLKKQTQGYEFPLFGENEDGEDEIIEVGADAELGNFFKLTTFQYNGWTRINIYYDDGSTEEIFEEKN